MTAKREHGQFSPGDVVEIWHSLRVPIICSVAAAVVIYKLYRSLQLLLRKGTAWIISLQLSKPLQSQKWIDVPTPADTPLLSQEKKEPVVSENGPRKPGNVAISVDFTLQKKKAPRSKTAPKRVTGKKLSPSRKKVRGEELAEKEGDFSVQILIFYSTITGSTERYAKSLKSALFNSTGESAYPTFSIPTPSNSRSDVLLNRSFLSPQIHNLEQIELEDYFINPPKSEGERKVKYIYLLLLPTYEHDSPNTAFLTHLQETHNDFRIDTAPLQSLAGFSVFGFGDSSEWPEEEGKFCRDAINADKWLGKLTGGRKGSRRMFPVGMGDVNPAGGIPEAESLKEWRIHLEEAIREYAFTGSLGEASNRAAVESGDEGSDIDEAQEGGKELMDVEDLGSVIRKNPDVAQKGDAIPFRTDPIPIDFTTPAGKRALQAGEGQSPSRKEMVPKDGITYNALTKQGYTIVGSHSGIKICRWTKSALRGRGSCYKFSFYGIKSHLCMETTPSLSCSNKCVFCWRHGTNPVGTTWRWKVDPPEEVFKGVVEGHYRKIKMLKGVPGVRADRFGEAFRIRHCALSLVGEPVFYPYINEFVHLLHASQISSFLVCNAQHPQQLAALGPVTQLYVSIDASNKDSLQRIDRPLHRDFWERFQSCLDILREKRSRQRTVFRLTLVKGFNIEDEVRGYADLVEKGVPGFVEVKGVTYCGTSSAGEAGLTMGNVPFYEEVVSFVEALNTELNTRGLGYGIAAEHAHSCCILIASNDYFIDGKWHTLIDYAKFFDLLESGKEFGPLDYVGEPTPEWANWGNGGFDPKDERVFRKGKKKSESCVAGEGEGESGCG